MQVGILFLFCILYIVVLNYTSKQLVFSILSAVFFSLISSAFLLWLNLVFRFYFPKGKNLLIALGWVTLLIFVNFILEKYFVNLLFLKEYYLLYVEPWFLIKLFVIILFYIFIVVYYYIHHKLKQIGQLNEKLQDSLVLQHQSELQLIQKQIQPHFLFNSLNSINALISIDPQQARNMIVQLSDFFRNSLKPVSNQLISLQEELNHVQLYLSIEQIRFGNRLQVHIEKPNSLNEFMVPSLILQPLIENAIKYGLYGTLEISEIKIYCSKNKNGNLEIFIYNSIDEEMQHTKKGTGFGLQATQRRMQLIYQNNNLVQIDKERQSFAVKLIFPQ